MPLRTEEATGVEAKAIGDVSRQAPDIDAAGLSQIALGDGARDRHRLLPMRESVYDLFPVVRRRNATAVSGPVGDDVQRLVLGQSFGLHQPVDAVAACTAAKTIKVVGVQLTRRLRIIVEWTGDLVVIGQRQGRQFPQRSEI